METIHPNGIISASLRARSAPARQGRLALDLPPPHFNLRLRTLAVRRICRELRRLAAGADPRDPATWERVAASLGIALCHHDNPDTPSPGVLVYVESLDRWVIALRERIRPALMARVLVHELAHFLERERNGEWVCGEEPVFCYDGGTGRGTAEGERHEIARRVEERLSGR